MSMHLAKNDKLYLNESIMLLLIVSCYRLEAKNEKFHLNLYDPFLGLLQMVSEHEVTTLVPNGLIK